MNWIDQVPSWYQGYISKVNTQDDLSVELERAQASFEDLVNPLRDEESLFRYEPGKWSIKDLTQHLIDAERVFSYRALRIARGDQEGMTGYDHNQFVDAASADLNNFSRLKDELSLLRKASILMFQNFNSNQLEKYGQVDENRFSVRMFGYIMAGHQLHHTAIIEEKYISRMMRS